MHLFAVDTSVPQNYDTTVLSVLWGCEP